MTCRMNKNKVVQLHFSELSDRERETVGSHVAECTVCRRYMEQLEKTAQFLDLWPDETPSPDTWNRIRHNLAAQTKTATRPKLSPSPFPLLALVLTILAFFTVSWFWGEKIVRLPLWRPLVNLGVLQVFGHFWGTLTLFLIGGLFATLALTPVLILEGRSRKNRFIS